MSPRLASNPDLSGCTAAALAWWSAEPSRLIGAIDKTLRIDPNDPATPYARLPFRLVADQGSNWIAAATHICPVLDPSAHWHPDIIGDVILWNPRTNDVRVMGEAISQSLVIGPDRADALTVYRDPFPFFRAWIETRAATWGRYMAMRDRKWQHGVNEPRDGGLPGALAIGDIATIKRWPDASTMIAGPGVDADALRRSVWASHNVPRVIGHSMKVAA